MFRQHPECGVEVSSTFEPEVGECYIGDITRVRQILVNLVSNAVKFTPAYGKVSVKISTIRGEGKFETLQFQVEDTGILHFHKNSQKFRNWNSQR